MLAEDYLLFLGALGWWVAVVFALVIPGFPGRSARRHTGWLVGFCAVRAVAQSPSLGLTGTLWISPWLNWAEGRQITGILAGMLLWECARRMWNEEGRRRISAATHLVAGEAIALTVAVSLASGSVAWAEWSLPVAVLDSILPAVLGAASAFLLWCLVARLESGPRFWLRLAVLGLGSYGVVESLPALTILGPVPSWLFVIGMGATSLATPLARTRWGPAFALGLVLAPLAGPLVAEVNALRVESSESDRGLAQGEQAAEPFQGRLAAQLEFNKRWDPRAGEKIQAALDGVWSGDPALRAVSIVEFRGDRIWTLDPREGFRDPRTATPQEDRAGRASRGFVLQERTGTPKAAATVFVPLRTARFEGPVAWLVLEYPATLWDEALAGARREGIASMGLLGFFCAVGFAFSGRQAAENAQRRHLERTEAASGAKTEFLAFLSHELRTPLQSMLGRAELLNRTGLDEPQARHLKVIEEQGRVLLRLVTDLLYFGNIEAGKLELRSTAFSLRSLLADLELATSPAAASKGLALTVVIAPAVPDDLVGDGVRLRQILANLLGNAVKFTSKGEVRLEVEEDLDQAKRGESERAEPGQRSEALLFRVTDTGPGLPVEEIPRLFSLFTRLDRADTFTREGTGVGLALVHRLCVLMGGAVTAANRPDGGAVFTVRLGIQRTQTPQQPVGLSGRTPAVSPTTDSRPPRLRVLVADDNRSGRDYLVEALQALGHRAEAVSDGEAALAACARTPYDAVFLDVNLPGRDGIAVARILSTHAPCPKLIGCSAEAFPSTRDAGLAAGMAAYLVKPANLDAIAAALEPNSATDSISSMTGGGSLFEKIRTPELQARAREELLLSWPASLESMRSFSLRTEELPALQRRAHQIRSTALIAGDPALAETLRRIEEAAALGELAAVRDLLSHSHPSEPTYASVRVPS